MLSLITTLFKKNKKEQIYILNMGDIVNVSNRPYACGFIPELFQSQHRIHNFAFEALICSAKSRTTPPNCNAVLRNHLCLTHQYFRTICWKWKQ